MTSTTTTTTASVIIYYGTHGTICDSEHLYCDSNKNFTCDTGLCVCCCNLNWQSLKCINAF